MALPLRRGRAAVALSAIVLFAAPLALTACGAASADSIADTIKQNYNANSPATMDSITCAKDLEATVGASTTCDATVTLNGGTSKQKVLVTAKNVSDGQIEPTIKTVAIDADATFVSGMLETGLTGGGATVKEVTCADGVSIAEGGDSQDVDCQVVGTDAQGADLAANYTATVNAEAQIEAQPAS